MKRGKPTSDYTFPLRKGSQLAADSTPISIIVPVGGSDRVEVIDLVLENLHAQNYGPYEVILSEYGMRGRQLYDRRWKFPTRYFYRKGGKLYNKSLAMNLGFVNARYSVCMLLDADILLPAGYLQSVADHMRMHDACFLLKRVLHVDVGNVQHDRLPRINGVRDDRFNGATLAITKEAFIRIGGMCEEFEGYGYEDMEFWDRLSRLLQVNERRKYDVLHLDHSHPWGFRKRWKRNQRIWMRLQHTVMDERVALLRRHLKDHYGVA